MEPWPVESCCSLLSPERELHIDGARWRAAAERFFDCDSFEVVEGSVEAREAEGLCFACVMHRRGELDAMRVTVQCMPAPSAAAVLRAADAAIDAIGGAGFDALRARCQSVWQVRGDDARAALLASAIIASVLLAPIVPPTADTIFGIRGARERLDRLDRLKNMIPSTQ